MGSDGKKNLLSKIAISDQHAENSPYFDGWKAYDSNPYHSLNNPDGVIQMGVAENQLSFDLIEKWIKGKPSIFTQYSLFLYISISLPHFRKAIAMFMERVRGDRVSFDPDRVVMAGGATGANELIMFCLANPGDAFLVPSPYYPAGLRGMHCLS
ncbi:hypothetical protein ACET3Z_016817 [Daucus carota]